MSKETIYKALIAGGLNHIGACAVMGNMMAESALRANNAQDGMTKLTDEDYTASADIGAIDFVYDKVGYGLCQWTFWTRKAQLMNYCRSRGVSVGDEDAQVQFCLQELRKDYASLFSRLTTAGNLYQAVSWVCKEFERPEINNIAVRHQCAVEIGQELERTGAALIEGGEEDKPDWVQEIEAHARAILKIVEEFK